MNLYVLVQQSDKRRLLNTDIYEHSILQKCLQQDNTEIVVKHNKCTDYTQVSLSPFLKLTFINNVEQSIRHEPGWKKEIAKTSWDALLTRFNLSALEKQQHIHNKTNKLSETAVRPEKG